MSDKKGSISEQFSGNAISSTMVFSMFVMIFFMVVDRYFYSSAKDMQRKSYDRKLGTD